LVRTYSSSIKFSTILEFNYLIFRGSLSSKSTWTCGIFGKDNLQQNLKVFPQVVILQKPKILVVYAQVLQFVAFSSLLIKISVLENLH
jgi:hypothetical protein